ncbi:MAG: pyridoxamine 5'-phosphate oxidase family protein [Clostridia bacterium]|nr:pyridoxamine 5'-phosphate oxidase family protein [Clostridia bacterium]
MNMYFKAKQVMEDLFAKDTQFALATAHANEPSVRMVDVYFEDDSFYLVTHAKSQKVRELTANSKVALCSKLHRFSGLASNLGHPLRQENQVIRSKLVMAFAPWYFAHNNEEDENLCFVRIVLQEGFFYQGRMGYRVDFREQKAEEFKFTYDIVEVS